MSPPNPSSDAAAAALRHAFGEVGEATDELTRAARCGDPEALAEAVRRREQAVGRLGVRIARYRQAARDGERILRREVDALETRARQAEEALRQLLSSTRDAAAALRRNSAGVRSYAAAPLEATALDRAG